MFNLDFVEEENTEALQKDCDPTLAGNSTFNEDNKLEQLDLFSILNTETEDMLAVSAKSGFMSLPTFPVEELVDFDQGVAMESDHHHLNQATIFTEGDMPFDPLPFTSSPCTSTSMIVESALTSPRFMSPPPGPSHQPSPVMPLTSVSSFVYPNIPNTPVSSQPSSSIMSFTPSPPPPPAPPTATYRQNSELDLICSVLQSEAQQPSTTLYTNSTQCSSNTISLDSNGIELINLLNSEDAMMPLNDNFSPFPSLSNSNDVLPHHGCSSSLMQSPLTVSDVANLGVYSTPKFSESPRYADTRPRTPSPSPFVPPSPVSSVTTECSESDYGKDQRKHSTRVADHDPAAKQIVSMPFYEFKKILESSSVSERDKEEAKVIRKRGKNKVAAKHCRQRKVEIVMGLEQEIEKLKGFKASLIMKALHLQKTIEEDKRKVGLRSVKNTSQTTTRLVI